MSKTIKVKKKAEEIPYFARIEDELKAQGVFRVHKKGVDI